MPATLRVNFIAGSAGQWRIVRIEPFIGEGLSAAERLLVNENTETNQAGVWQLRGVISNLRYTHAEEVRMLRSKQEGLGRQAAKCAALIPIRKTAAWWDLAQDERRSIFEEQSRHIAIGLEYLPGIARRLHHCRDLGGEPFDFLTWFEYAPEHSDAFEELVKRLRETREWEYVEREVDIRLLCD